ncbi:hypothetical protein [Nonomuraea sp. NPDC049129]|uniref:hypothetical protein n=1 Tax=Nonomuraea sp. NPDC049129 TaxID=3155272 RepID=UPI00340C2257
MRGRRPGGRPHRRPAGIGIGEKVGDNSVVCVYVHTVPAGETERRLTFHITH